MSFLEMCPQFRRIHIEKFHKTASLSPSPAVMCPRLDEPVDGYLRITGLVVGAETVYFCDDGFRISGFLRRRCLATGEWNGEDTVCNRELLEHVPIG